MSTTSKDAEGSRNSETRSRGVRIFTYPKVIFLMPTLIAALVCGIGMTVIKNRTIDPGKTANPVVEVAKVEPVTRDTVDVKATQTAEDTVVVKASPTSKDKTTLEVTEYPKVVSRRFGSTQNFMAISFLVVFALNLIILSFDFPRFTVIALVTAFAALGFFVLWLNVYFELLPPIVRLLDHIYVVANAEFYFGIATIILLNFAVILVTRYLDYWEVLPNELLHNHGPFSDLDRYPTAHLKFSKEIPDILEYALLRSGRLVMNVPGQNKAIVLDNVLWINRKEEELKKLLSRMDVRVTMEQQENSAPGT